MKKLAAILLLVGCDPQVRFADRAILWKDPDDKPIPLPRSVDASPNWIGFRDATFLPADRVLSLDDAEEAVNANALDEVPDSSWFVDLRREVDARGQMRLRHFTAGEMERGATGEFPPPTPPFTVTKGKGIGANVGFQLVDARGVKYLFKLDPPGLIGLDTQTEIVCTRLYWSAGWLVPAEWLIDFRPSDLILEKGAKTKDRLGDDVPLDQAGLDALVRTAPLRPDGTIRAIASRWIPGKILGPFAYFGRRKDDPNDRIPHEDRRDLRGFGIFSMWINNLDTLETNTLDAYVGEPGHGHLQHWQQDVGGAFGSRAQDAIEWWMGSDIYLAPTRIVGSLLGLGFVRRPWDSDEVRWDRARESAAWPELGFFDSRHFDPRHWHPVLDNPAFLRQTARDRYWGMKRVLAVSADELRGAIASGHYRPEAAEHLFEVLWKRRDRMARVFLAELAPLDGFRFDGARVCFDDLWITAGLGGGAWTQYRAESDGAELPVLRDCAELPRRAGYRVLALTVKRPGDRRFSRPVRVHLVEAADGARRFVGIER
jgi:hypothetical protein